MKKKLRKVLPRLLALFLILVMVMTPSLVEVFAARDDETVTTPPIKISGSGEQGTIKAPATATGEPTNTGALNSNTPKDPNCDGYEVQGVLLRLQSIPNMAKHDFAQEYMEQYNQSQTLENKISECQISAVDMFLYDFPAYFVGNTNVINDTAIILQRGSIYRDTAKYGEPIAYRTGEGYQTTESFANVYNVNLDSSAPGQAWFPANLAYGRLVAEAGYLDTLLAGEMDVDTLKSILSSVTPEEKRIARDNILLLFKDTSKLSEMLGGIWTNAQNAKDHLGRPIQDVYRLFYLDMLLAINYMCGESYWNEIGMYLEWLNANGADTFVIPIMANVMVTRYPGEAVAYAATLPDYYGYISGHGANTFLQLESLNQYVPVFAQQENDGRQDLSSNYSSHTRLKYMKQIKRMLALFFIVIMT